MALWSIVPGGLYIFPLVMGDFKKKSWQELALLPLDGNCPATCASFWLVAYFPLLFYSYGSILRQFLLLFLSCFFSSQDAHKYLDRLVLGIVLPVIPATMGATLVLLQYGLIEIFVDRSCVTGRTAEIILMCNFVTLYIAMICFYMYAVFYIAEQSGCIKWCSDKY
eukprot:UN24045